MGEVIWEKDPDAPKPLKRYTVRAYWINRYPGYKDYEYHWRWMAKLEAWKWTINGFRAQVIDNYPVPDAPQNYR